MLLLLFILGQMLIPRMKIQCRLGVLCKPERYTLMKGKNQGDGDYKSQLIRISKVDAEFFPISFKKFKT